MVFYVFLLTLFDMMIELSRQIEQGALLVLCTASSHLVMVLLVDDSHSKRLKVCWMESSLSPK